MSRLSDIWHGIRSGFDINKMKRDPLGSISKIGLIYGVGSTAVGAFAPDIAKRAGDWLKSGFGFYDTPIAADPYSTRKIYNKDADEWIDQKYYDYGKAPIDRYGKRMSEMEYIRNVGKGQKTGFLENITKGTGKFLAKPFDLGMDINNWTKGGLSWNDIKSKHFNWVNTDSISEMAQLTNALRGGGPGGGPGGDRGKSKVAHRQFSRGMPSAGVNISAAREGGMYKQNGISKALITGNISPETLAMLGYGSGQVTGAQERSIDLEDVGKIKTTLTSAIG